MALPRVLQVVRGVAVFSAAAVVTWLAQPSPIGSLAWVPSPVPALDGPYARNDALLAARWAYTGVARGADDLAFDADGRVYAGLGDGRLVRFEGDRVVDVARPGRLLGLDVGPDGNVYACAPDRGLLRIAPAGGDVEVLVDTVEGYPLRMANDVEVARDGVVYFTDASAVWGPEQVLEDILDQRPSGRVLRYDPRTKETLVIARELSFASGLALTDDENALLVAEAGRYQVWRLWLAGDKKNLREVVAGNLPGFPDDLTSSPRGTTWIALSSGRKRLIDAVHPHPFLKDAIATLPRWARPSFVSTGFVIELDPTGAPIRSLQDPDGVHVGGVTSVEERDGTLWLGSNDGDGVARVSLH